MHFACILASRPRGAIYAGKAADLRRRPMRRKRPWKDAPVGGVDPEWKDLPGGMPP